MKKNIVPIMLLVITSSYQLLAQTPRTEFTIELSTYRLEIKPGERKAIAVKLLRSKGYTKSKAVFGLSSNLPDGITVTFEQQDDLLQATAASITASENVNPGTYQLLLNCKINNKSKATTLKLIVGSPEGVTKLDRR